MRHTALKGRSTSTVRKSKVISRKKKKKKEIYKYFSVQLSPALSVWFLLSSSKVQEQEKGAALTLDKSTRRANTTLCPSGAGRKKVITGHISRPESRREKNKNKLESFALFSHPQGAAVRHHDNQVMDRSVAEYFKSNTTLCRGHSL